MTPDRTADVMLRLRWPRLPCPVDPNCRVDHLRNPRRRKTGGAR